LLKYVKAFNLKSVMICSLMIDADYGGGDGVQNNVGELVNF
jgi:hypothetical protein